LPSLKGIDSLVIAAILPPEESRGEFDYLIILTEIPFEFLMVSYTTKKTCLVPSDATYTEESIFA